MPRLLTPPRTSSPRKQRCSSGVPGHGALGVGIARRSATFDAKALKMKNPPLVMCAPQYDVAKIRAHQHVAVLVALLSHPSFASLVPNRPEKTTPSW
jgi:hypothetical protein